MYRFLLALLVLDGVFLAVVILLQAGKGGGLAAVGGGAAATEVLGGRQATTLLTRATWGAGAAFMLISLILAVLSSRTAAPASVLEGVGAPASVAPAPVLGGGDEGGAVALPGLDETPAPSPDAGDDPPDEGSGEPPPGPTG